jgi:hypothetical protein
MAVTGGERRDPGPQADASENSLSPDQTAEPSHGLEISEDHANAEVTTPEQEAKLESEERIRGLLKAYQETLETVEQLPAVVWVPWDRKRPGSYFKVPYLRWFLTYFVVHHIDRSLNTLNPPLSRDRCGLWRPRLQQVEPRDHKALPSVVTKGTVSAPDLRGGARGADDSASSAGIRKRILRARPRRGDVEIRRDLREQSIRRERNRPHGAVLDRSPGRTHRGGRPNNLSVRLEAHTLQLASLDQ